jgi:eukaryotic-like serine/threonine-protein kinase
MEPIFSALLPPVVKGKWYFESILGVEGPLLAMLVDGSANTFSVKPGDTLAGKYRIERLLGQGGMGMVVAARHVDLDEMVALKFVLPDVVHNPEIVARFMREGRAAVKIKSEHVARVFDVGRLDNGAPYLVMEYLKGSDLGEHLRGQGPLPAGEAVRYMLQACEALAEAHAMGIVHRDLKPANLFLTQRADGSPCIKVLDFGISKLCSIQTAGLTRAGGMMGSAFYMPPEQLQAAKDVDARADIWALGVTLYELLTGRLPFFGDELPQLVLAIMSAEPTPIRSIRPDIPEGLERVVRDCLQKDRTHRIPDVAVLGSALAPFGSSSAVQSVQRISRVLRGDPGTAPVSEPLYAAAPLPAQPMSCEAPRPEGTRAKLSFDRTSTAASADAGQALAHATAAGWGGTTPEPPEDLSLHGIGRSAGARIALGAVAVVGAVVVIAFAAIRGVQGTRGALSNGNFAPPSAAPAPASAAALAAANAPAVLSGAPNPAAPSASTSKPASIVALAVSAPPEERLAPAQPRAGDSLAVPGAVRPSGAAQGATPRAGRGTRPSASSRPAAMPSPRAPAGSSREDIF